MTLTVHVCRCVSQTLVAATGERAGVVIEQTDNLQRAVFRAPY